MTDERDRLAPTPVWMEAYGRALARYGEAGVMAHFREELRKIHESGEAASLTHEAVAAKFPHLYTRR